MNIRKDRKAIFVVAAVAAALFVLFRLPIERLWASNTMLSASGLIGQFPSTTTSLPSVDFVSGNANNGGSVSALGFSAASATAYDVARNYLFVSDTGNNRVLVYNLNDVDAEYYTADYVLGQVNFTDHTGGSNQYSFSNPLGLAYDSVDQRLFVVDNTNTRVLVYDVRPSGSPNRTSCGITTDGIANGMSASCVIGSTDINTFSMSSMAGSLFGPDGIAYDSATGHLFVSQVQGNRVTVFHAGLLELTDNGPDAFHVYGQLDFNGTTNDWDDLVYGAGVPSSRTLYSPRGLAYDDTTGLLYVADDDNGRVVVYDTTLVEILTAGDDASYALGKPDLNSYNWTDPLNAGGPFDETPRQNSSFSPVGVAIDTVRHLLFVSDADYTRIMVYDVRSNGSAPEVFCGTTSTGIASGMDASCVYGQPDFTTIGTGTDSKMMTFPYHLTYISSTHELVVADHSNNRLLFFNVASPSTYASANDEFGHITVDTSYTFDDSSPDFSATTMDSGAPVVNEYGVRDPRGVAIDTDNHRMFISDKNNNRVLVFNLETDNTITNFAADYVLGQSDFSSRTSATTAGGLSSPDGLTYWHAPSGTEYLFVADNGNNRVMAYDVSSITNGEDAIVVIGQADFTSGGSVGTTQRNLANPTDVAVDSVANHLYVADAKNTRITVYDIATLTSTNMPAMAVIGQSNYTTNTSGLSATKFNEPDTLLYEPNSRYLYATDPRNSRVMVFNTATITSETFNHAAVAVLGQTLFTDNTNAVTQGGMSYPSGLAYDSENSLLFVSDSSANRVSVYNVSTITNGEDAIAVIGQLNFTNSTSGASSTLVHAPVRAMFDNSNTLYYLVDATNNRILQFDFIKLITDTIGGTGTVGTPYTNALDTTGVLGVASFELVSGTMPTGLSFDATGIIGTPTVAGTYNFVVRAIDTIADAGTFLSNQKSYSVVVAAAATGGGGGGSTPLCEDIHANNYNQPVTCDFDAPTLTIVTPQASGTFSTTVTTTSLTGTASDNDTVTTIMYSLNGAAAVAATGTTSWSTSALSLVNGSNVVLVTAYNNHGKQTSKTLTIVYSPTITPPDPTCADDPTLPGCTTVVTPPDPVCTEPAATNFNGPLPCVYPSEVDLCPNITGAQTSVPAGYEIVLGMCNPIPTPVTVTPPGGGGGGGGYVPPVVPRVDGVATEGFGWLGLIVGFIATMLSAFSGALALSEIAFIPTRIWQLILGALGFKKKVRHWGIVYDSVTKQPLDPAYVMLYDKDGKEVATAITDLEGRYGFLVQPGIYRIEANKTNYLFPSRTLHGKHSDEMYRDLYFGDYFEVLHEGDVIVKNIPLDPQGFDWNEYVKHERGLVKQRATRSRIFSALANVLFYGGFLASIVVLYLEQSALNIALVAIYVFLFILRQFVIKRPSYGRVSNHHEPLPFGVVKVYSAKLGTLMTTKVLDKYGRYYMLAPKGSYYATVDEKRADQSYATIHKTEAFTNTKGVINKKFKI